MVGLMFYRIIPSIATCCKNKNTCHAIAKNSIGCASCICVFELICYALLLLSLVMIFLGMYYIFSDSKHLPRVMMRSVVPVICMRVAPF